jgi:uncharacterized membrane protein
MRGAGRKPLHDEGTLYAKHVAALERADDRAAFATSFNGVFLEGVEAVIIILALAAGSVAALPWAAGGGIAALLIVAAIGIALHRPLERVPENAMKFLVGTMLTTFGIFWIGEGAGVRWPGDDASIALLAAVIFATSLIAVRALRRAPSLGSS